MIAGFVSVMRSETIARDGMLGCHATTVIATVQHQSSEATAGCAPSAHGENCVSGLSAPITICATNVIAVARASGPSPSLSWRCRHACQQPASTTTPTIAATQRCAICTAAAPNTGSEPSSQSGHVVHAVVASSPRTYAPVSMRTNVPTAPARSSAVHGAPRSRAAMVDGQRTPTASVVSTARMSSAFARCAVTQVCGSSRMTTMAPMSACEMYRRPAATTSATSRRFERYATSVVTTSAASARPPATPRKRWNHSIWVDGSRLGRNCPWQVGQSGQPRPEPDTRTTPPQTTTRNDVSSVR